MVGGWVEAGVERKMKTVDENMKAALNNRQGPYELSWLVCAEPDGTCGLSGGQKTKGRATEIKGGVVSCGEKNRSGDDCWENKTRFGALTQRVTLEAR